ncbi:hypothetical protein AAMO2058_000781500 [Amorphochlora amoebiformis]
MREVRMLENELMKTCTLLEEANRHNRDLRLRIDQFRTHKESFDARHRKMRRDLQRRKRQLARATEAGKKLQGEASELREEAKRLTREVEEAERNVAEGKQSKKDIDLPNPKTYEQAFENIMRCNHGVYPSLHALIKDFVDHEDTTLETQNVRKELAVKQTQVEQYQQKGTARGRHREIVDGLDAKLKKAKAVNDSYDSKHNDAMHIMDQVKKGISDLLIMLEDFRHTPALNSAPSSTDIVNVVKDLGSVEELVSTLLEQYDKNTKTTVNVNNSKRLSSTSSLTFSDFLSLSLSHYLYNNFKPIYTLGKDVKSGSAEKGSGLERMLSGLSDAGVKEEEEAEEEEEEDLDVMPMSIAELRAKVAASMK